MTYKGTFKVNDPQKLAMIQWAATMSESSISGFIVRAAFEKAVKIHTDLKALGLSHFTTDRDSKHENSQAPLADTADRLKSAAGTALAQAIILTCLFALSVLFFQANTQPSINLEPPPYWTGVDCDIETGCSVY